MYFDFYNENLNGNKSAASLLIRNFFEIHNKKFSVNESKYV